MVGKKKETEKEIFLKKFGNHLRNVRLQKGLTGAELARILFMDKPNITRLEKGRTNPSLYILKQYAEALDISLEELFKGFKHKNTSK